jgi:nickel-type superoxide dismutase maturation protease
MLWPLTRFIVEDASMSPTLLPGDRLLVARWGRMRHGDLVVFEDPQLHGRFLVKRVAARLPGAYVVIGDNAALSRDSRSFGPVSAGLVVGRVVWRYLPGSRRGRVSRV